MEKEEGREVSGREDAQEVGELSWVWGHLPLAQVFFLLKDSELTPVGANLLDGRFSVRDSGRMPSRVCRRLAGRRIDGRRWVWTRLCASQVFGYVVSGQDALGSMHVGDKIQYIKVVDGQQFLKNGPSGTVA